MLKVRTTSGALVLAILWETLTFFEIDHFFQISYLPSLTVFFWSETFMKQIEFRVFGWWPEIIIRSHGFFCHWFMERLDSIWIFNLFVDFSLQLHFLQNHDIMKIFDVMKMQHFLQNDDVMKMDDVVKRQLGICYQFFHSFQFFDVLLWFWKLISYLQKACTDVR